MTSLELYALGVTVLLLVVLAAHCFTRSKYHYAKAEVYQEFADTFCDMGSWVFAKDKQRKQAEQKRQWMRLVLCDPICADALRDALVEGDQYWRRSSGRAIAVPVAEPPPKKETQ